MIESWCLSFSSLVHYMVRRKASLSSIPSHSLLLSCLSSPRILSVPTTQSEWREREKRWKGRKKGLHSYLLLSIPCHIIPAPKRWKWHEGMERRGKEMAVSPFALFIRFLFHRWLSLHLTLSLIHLLGLFVFSLILFSFRAFFSRNNLQITSASFMLPRTCLVSLLCVYNCR